MSTEPDPFGSTGGFPPQKPKPPDLFIKATKSDEIERFFDKELLENHQIQWYFLFSDEDLLEIHQIRQYFLFSDEDLLEIHQIRRDLIKIYSRLDRSSQISARSRPIRQNIGTGDETRNQTDTNPKPDGYKSDDSTIKTGQFQFRFLPTQKIRVEFESGINPTRGHP